MRTVDPLKFYDLIREYFIEMSELEGAVISPLFGQKRNIPLSDTVYFEILGDKILDIKVAGSKIIQLPYVSKFNANGIDCDMLTIETHCHLDELPTLWKLRNRWIISGLQPE